MAKTRVRAEQNTNASTGAARTQELQQTLESLLRKMQRMGSKAIREQVGPRYGIHTDKSFGIAVGDLRKLAASLGKDHELALALWESGWYEARLLATMVDVAKAVTPAQMDQWCKDFDNWAITDTACFGLFDRTPHAFTKVRAWARRKPEFEKRAAFALLAGLALHDKKTADAEFLACFPLISKAADDERNFVKKGVSWAVRSIAGRSLALHSACMDLASQLAAADDAASRWVGKEVLRDISRPLVVARAKKKSAARG